jgi:predicted RNase H-like HicB family nuclease
MREFQVIIEKDSDGILIAEVPSLKSCYTQAKSYDELMIRIKEAIELCLETQEEISQNEFVGIQKVTV